MARSVPVGMSLACTGMMVLQPPTMYFACEPDLVQLDRLATVPSDPAKHLPTGHYLPSILGS
jgi:hypothetical protein